MLVEGSPASQCVAEANLIREGNQRLLQILLLIVLSGKSFIILLTGYNEFPVDSKQKKKFCI